MESETCELLENSHRNLRIAFSDQCGEDDVADYFADNIADNDNGDAVDGGEVEDANNHGDVMRSRCGSIRCRPWVWSSRSVLDVEDTSRIKKQRHWSWT